jgi:exosortase A-associated hydrolase 2
VNRGKVCAEFVGEDGQRIFILAHHPEKFSGRCVLICPPFAEEMNKSRRMLTELAQRLMQEDIGLVIPDLYGTGDSEGDFADASIDRWIEDLAFTEQWIKEKGWYVDALLGIRLGCMLALKYADGRGSHPIKAIFWQPSLEGSRELDQFLRLRVAASMMADIKETVSGLKEIIALEKALEISGYTISEKLARDMEVLRLNEVSNQSLSELNWFQVLRDQDAQLPMPVRNVVDQLKLKVKIQLDSIVGESFWASNEVNVHPGLIDKTVISLIGK